MRFGKLLVIALFISIASLEASSIIGYYEQVCEPREKISLGFTITNENDFPMNDTIIKLNITSYNGKSIPMEKAPYFLYSSSTIMNYSLGNIDDYRNFATEIQTYKDTPTGEYTVNVNISFNDPNGIRIYEEDNLKFKVKKSTSVNVTPPIQFVSVGKTFTISVTVDPGEPIAGVQFDLSFDPSIITANSVIEGDLFDGFSTYFFNGTIDNINGTITGVAGVITSPGGSVSSPGTFATISFTTGSTDGASFLNLSNVIVGDPNGNPVPIMINNGTVNVKIDVLPPTTTKEIGYPKYDNGIWVSTSTNFTLTAEDDESGINKTYYRIWSSQTGWYGMDEDDTWINETGIRWWIYDEPFNMKEECLHYLEFYSVDNVGNEEEHHNQTHYVDDTPPTSSKIVGDPKYGDWVTTNTEITLEAEDKGECPVGSYQIFYRIWHHGSWGAWIAGPMNSSVTFKFTEECKHYLEWYAIDDLGNEEEHYNQTHYVDDTPPTSSKIVGDPKYGDWVTTNTEITLEAEDKGECPVGSYQIFYRIWHHGSWGAWIAGPMNSSVTFKFTEECKHYLEWYAEDDLGNIETKHNQTHFVDDTPPSSWIVVGKPSHGDWIKTGTPITLYANDKGKCPVASYQIFYRIWWNGEWSDWISGLMNDSITIYFNEECKHRIEWYAKDKLGNEEEHHLKYYYVDDTPPIVEVIYPNGGENVKGTIIIKWNAFDNIDTDLSIAIKYSNDNGTTWYEIERGLNNTGFYSWDTKNVLDGKNYLIMVSATDNSRNTDSDVSNNTFTIENILPIIQSKASKIIEIIRTPVIKPSKEGELIFNMTNPYPLSMENVSLTAEIYYFVEHTWFTERKSCKISNIEHPFFENGNEKINCSWKEINEKNSTSLLIISNKDTDQGTYFVRFHLEFDYKNIHYIMKSIGFFTNEQWEKATSCGTEFGGVNTSILGIDAIIPETTFGVKQPIPLWPLYLLIAVTAFLGIVAVRSYIKSGVVEEEIKEMKIGIESELVMELEKELATTEKKIGELEKGKLEG